MLQLTKIALICAVAIVWNAHVSETARGGRGRGKGKGECFIY